MGPVFSYQLLSHQSSVWTVTDLLKTGYWSLSSGPEGIRTPDLLSAIEARSQLRYRPMFKAKIILIEAEGYVKQGIL